MTRIFPLAISLALLTPSGRAWSQVPPGPAQKAAPTEANDKAAPPETTGTTVQADATGPRDSAVETQPDSVEVEIESRRKKALVEYGIGNVEPALDELKALIKKCDQLSTDRCPNALRARLYVALGIVLAGGKDDIEGGARLFHAALTRDETVTVPREFATLPVQAAMRRANESTNYPELSEPAPEEPSAPDPTPPPETAASDSQEELPRDNKTGIILIHALGGAGADDFGDAASLGAAMVLGARFVDSSAWTTAIRGRAAIVGQDQEAVGGVSLLMGGSWFNPKNRRMGYFLGGVGLDSFGGEGGFSLNGMGGVTLGGFLLGGGLDFGASGYGSFAMMTLHLGWGARL